MFVLYCMSVIVFICVTYFYHSVEKDDLTVSAFAGLVFGSAFFGFMMLGVACYEHQFGR